MIAIFVAIPAWVIPTILLSAAVLVGALIYMAMRHETPLPAAAGCEVVAAEC